MRRTAIVVFLLMGGLMSCLCQKEQKGTAQSSPNADAPNKTQVDIVIHGLVGLIPSHGGCTTVFVSPQDPAMEHVPLLSLETGSLGNQNPSLPDLVAPGYKGNGLALWRFTKISVDPNDVADKALILDDSALAPQETNFAKMRWIPHPDDIFGQHVDYETSPLPEKVAIGDWPPGQLTPIWDPVDLDTNVHKQVPWTICNRKHRSLADGFRLRLTIVNSGTMLNLHVTRNNMPEEVISVVGGSTIMLSNFPKVLPKTGKDMTHFTMLYVLIKPQGLPACTDPVEDPNPSAALPARCAPLMFPEES